MFVMHPLVHNYSVITLDNWHLAYCDRTQSKDHKTVDRECFFYTAISINCMDVFLLRLIFVWDKVLFRKH